MLWMLVFSLVVGLTMAQPIDNPHTDEHGPDLREHQVDAILTHLRRLQQEMDQLKVAVNNLQTTPSPDFAGCPSGFTYVGATGSCYKVGTGETSWAVANNNCNSYHNDAHLIVIDNNEDHIAVTGIFDSNHFWTALQREEPDSDTFVWKVTNSTGYYELPLEYDSWRSGEPNNSGGGEGCMYAFYDSGQQQWLWNDIPCSSDLYYICEYEL